MFSQTLAHENSKNEIRKETDEEGKKRGMSIETKQAGKKETPDDVSHPNQNIITIYKKL